VAHLEDKIAEFFYKELPESEMAGTRQHIETCEECRHRLYHFERTHLALKQSPDVDPPRHIVFAPPEPRFRRPLFDWRIWAPLSTAAAALIISALTALRPAVGPVSVSIPAAAPVVFQAQAPPPDVRQEDRAWLAGELQKRDMEIRRLQGELAYYESVQRAVMRENLENASSIQLLAQRAGSGN